jgi:hypothetical protein
VLIDVEGAQGTTNARRRIGVVPGREVARGPGETVRGTGFDVALTPHAREVRRGDAIEASVVAGPDEADADLEVGLLCRAAAYSATGTTNEGSTIHAWVPLAETEEWLPAGGACRWMVPADAPPSFADNGAVRVNWWIEVRERRRMRKDRVVSAPIQVLP